MYEFRLSNIGAQSEVTAFVAIPVAGACEFEQKIQNLFALPWVEYVAAVAVKVWPAETVPENVAGVNRVAAAVVVNVWVKSVD